MSNAKISSILSVSEVLKHGRLFNRHDSDSYLIFFFRK